MSNIYFIPNWKQSGFGGSNNAKRAYIARLPKETLEYEGRKIEFAVCQEADIEMEAVKAGSPHAYIGMGGKVVWEGDPREARATARALSAVWPTPLGSFMREVDCQEWQIVAALLTGEIPRYFSRLEKPAEPVKAPDVIRFKFKLDRQFDGGERTNYIEKPHMAWGDEHRWFIIQVGDARVSYLARGNPRPGKVPCGHDYALTGEAKKKLEDLPRLSNHQVKWRGVEGLPDPLGRKLSTTNQKEAEDYKKVVEMIRFWKAL